MENSLIERAEIYAHDLSHNLGYEKINKCVLMGRVESSFLLLSALFLFSMFFYFFFKPDSGYKMGGLDLLFHLVLLCTLFFLSSLSCEIKELFYNARVMVKAREEMKRPSLSDEGVRNIQTQLSNAFKKINERNQTREYLFVHIADLFSVFIKMLMPILIAGLLMSSLVKFDKESYINYYYFLFAEILTFCVYIAFYVFFITKTRYEHGKMATLKW